MWVFDIGQTLDFSVVKPTIRHPYIHIRIHASPSVYVDAKSNCSDSASNTMAYISNVVGNDDAYLPKCQYQEREVESC